MARRVLITGGAGFIGSHLADELLDHGYEVRCLDVLHPQVHGRDRKRPSYHVTGRYRMGDIRHCFADAGKAKRLLGFTAEVPLDEGMERLREWLSDQVAEDRAEQARQELEQRGLTL